MKNPVTLLFCVAFAGWISSVSALGQSANSSSDQARPASNLSTTLKLDSAVKLTSCADNTSSTRIELIHAHRNYINRLITQGLEGYPGRHVYSIGGLLPTFQIAAQAGSTGSAVAASQSYRGDTTHRESSPLPDFHPVVIDSIERPCFGR
jgi:hypothetical protein